jgi:hypothetical protein
LPAGIDGRTSTARRFRDLVTELSIELGKGRQLTAGNRNSIRQVAAIQLRLEQLQARVVAGGDGVDNDALIRLSSESRRAFAALRRRVAKDNPSPEAPPSFSSLRSRWSREDAEVVEAATPALTSGDAA